MSKRPARELRSEREQVLSPLFTYVEGRGMRRAWLARQLNISRALLWNYEHGVTRISPDFVERACRIVGIPTGLICIPANGADYIQQPRTRKSSPTAATTAMQPVKQQPASKRTQAKGRPSHVSLSSSDNVSGNGNGGQSTVRRSSVRRTRSTQTTDYPTTR
jgi:transcriptional regulator with XRE-family HTH domain